MQVYQTVVVANENDKKVPVGAVGVVVGANDPVAVKFDDPDGKNEAVIVEIPAADLRVL